MTKGEAMRSAEKHADERQLPCYIVEHRPGEWSLSTHEPLGIVRALRIGPRKPGALQYGSTWHGRI